MTSGTTAPEISVVASPHMSPGSTSTPTGPRSQVPGAAASRPQSNVPTVSVASPRSPDASWPAFQQVYQPPKQSEVDNSNAVHEAKSHGAALSELPVSHCCAMQRSFSGSASPASAASPTGGNNNSLRGRDQRGADVGSNSNQRVDATPASAHDDSVPVRREQCTAALGGVGGGDSMHGSETADLVRVQTAIYDGVLSPCVPCMCFAGRKLQTDV